MKVTSFLPEIITTLDRQPPWCEWMSGAVLFADVSGFTPLSETLSVLGAAGSEMLTDTLNRYFSEMVSIVHSCSGEVMKFGGDSILCLFTGEYCSQNATLAAFKMQQASSAFKSVRTPSAKFKLLMKIGIAHGEVLLAAIGDPAMRCDYVFAGEAVEKASQAEKQAVSGEIVIHEGRRQPRFTSLRASPLLFGKLRSQIHHRAPITPSKSSFIPFLIPEVAAMVDKGYEKHVGAHQRVVSAFLQFKGFTFQRTNFSIRKLHEFFSTLMEITETFKGRLNSFNVDDKGENLFFHFGAPNRLEKKEEAAAGWALELQEKLGKNYPRVDIRIGITEGMVFWGIVGGSGRFHYTVVGDSVNVAARLMQSANKRQICVNQTFRQKLATSFRFAGPAWKTFRGKKASIPVYRLQQRKGARVIPQEHQLIGRTVEFQQILEHLHAARKGSPRLIIIEGEAGVGKSFFADHVQVFARKNGWRTASGKSEITRRSHSYVPWLQVFEELVFERTGRSAELQNMLRLPDSPPAGMDESAQKSRLHHQLSMMILDATKHSPTLIFLDDLHFFDSLSAELLSALMNHWKDQTLFVLAATRPEWDKSPFVERNDCYLVKLSELSRDSVSELAAFVLGGHVRKALIDFIVKQTRGNPFFTRQLLEYLKQNDLLVRVAGEWTISRDGAENQSLSGEELIVSQIDHLALNEKIHLRAAACMGPTFSLAVLEQALGKHFQMATLRTLRERGYFAESGEGWLSFPHALVQEALYHSLTIRLRKQTHRRIGKVMESLLIKRDPLYYANLANHFRLAGIRRKAIHYSIAAADQLFAALSFPEARSYFQTAFELLQRGKDPRKWEIGLKLAKTMIHTGNTIAALQLARKLRRQSRRMKLRDYNVEASILQFDAMRRISDYRYLPFALRLLNATDKVPAASRLRLIHLTGSTLFWVGRPDRAEYFLRQLVRPKAISRQSDTALSAHVFLATIAADRQDFRAAYEIIHSALQLAQQTGNVYQELRIRNEWAGILLDNQRVKEAKTMLAKLLPRAEALGDFYLVALVLVGLGDVAVKQQKWEAAETYLQDAVALFSSLGLGHGKAKALLLKGVAAFYRQEYSRAMNLYEGAVEIFEKGGEMVEACHGYYNLSEVCMVLGRKKEAQDWYKKGIHSFRAKDNPQLARLYAELRSMFSK